MANREIVVLLSTDKRYWNSVLFKSDLDRLYPEHSLRARARILDISPQHLRLLCSEKGSSPNTETLMRLYARTGRRPGAWLRGVKKI